MREFVYDGTFEGLLSAIFYAYSYKYECRIVRENNYEMNFMNQVTTIHTEIDKSKRVYNSILNKLSNTVLENVYMTYLSDFKDSDTLILKYLKLCYKYGININLAKNNDVIIKIDSYVKKVLKEVDKFIGFVRFKEIGTLSYYAAIEPDHNILPLLVDHFQNRFSDQNYIIHDLKREKAIAYNKEYSVITDLKRDYFYKFKTTSKEKEYDNLWKVFYKATDIEERKNLKLQAQFMPTRYWKHLNEID